MHTVKDERECSMRRSPSKVNYFYFIYFDIGHFNGPLSVQTHTVVAQELSCSLRFAEEITI